MDKYMGLVKQRLRSFTAWKLEHFLRDSNERVDAFAVVAGILMGPGPDSLCPWSAWPTM